MVVRISLALVLALPATAVAFSHGIAVSPKRPVRVRHTPTPRMLSEPDQLAELQTQLELLRLKQQLAALEAAAQERTAEVGAAAAEPVARSFLDGLLPSQLTDIFSTLTRSEGGSLEEAQRATTSMVQSAIAAMTTAPAAPAVSSMPPSPEVAADFSAMAPGLGDALGQASGLLSTLDTWVHTPVLAQLTPTGMALQLGAIALFGLGSAIATADGGNEAPYQPGTDSYDPKRADDFYAKRPLLVANRLASLGWLTSAFTAGVLHDWLILGKLLKDTECVPSLPTGA